MKKNVVKWILIALAIILIVFILVMMCRYMDSLAPVIMFVVGGVIGYYTRILYVRYKEIKENKTEE